MVDPLFRLAVEQSLQKRLAQAVDGWLATEIQLNSLDSPLFNILVLARDDAADALAMLAGVDPEDAKAIRALQNRVSLFFDHVRFIRTIISRGKEAAPLLNAEIQRDIQNYVSPEERQEAEELGLVEEELNDA